MSKTKKRTSAIFQFLTSFARRFARKRGLYIPVCISALIIIVATYINMSEYAYLSTLSIEEFKVDMAPSRDVVATEDVKYVDEDSTFKKKNAKKRSLGAVFERSDAEDIRLKKDYEAFIIRLRLIMEGSQDDRQFIERMSRDYSSKNEKTQYIGNISPDALSLLFRTSNKYDIINLSTKIFADLIASGVADISPKVLEEYGRKDVTLSYIDVNKEEVVDFSHLIFLNSKEGYTNIDVEGYIADSLAGKAYDYELVIPALIKVHIKPNLMYSKDETERRIQREIAKIPDEIITIHKGEKIIEKNIVIKEEAYNRLEKYIENRVGGIFIDDSLFFAFILYIVSLYAVAFFLFSEEVFGEVIEDKYFLLLLLMSTFLYLEILFLQRVSLFSSTLAMIPILPSALFSMLFYILKSKKMAIFTSFLFTLSALGASNFNVPLSIFVAFSSILGVSLTRNTGRRIDLIKTASILALLQPIIVFVFSFLFPTATGDVLYIMLGSLANGFLSGILLLGFLPLLEVILNCPTTFRLIEISDLNSPLMKQMLINVSGTYSHSMMVATLAETACREIGANALLARVGAYYHDVGKMTMGEYFIENQQGGVNKHDSITPCLSATVLRSHVQRSIERAKSLHLPEAVIDIVAEHHGNGLIAYFYNKARESGKNVDMANFSYPGNKPKSRESAVVMLADMTEAGCRSLSKHSVPALTKFINAIFKAKIDSGQLDESKLTFADITTIKNAFIDILSGYYHSRIKYPNQKDDDEEEKKEKEKQMKEKNESSQ